MKILITGANGFIGRALCKKMKFEGYHVRGALREVSQMKVLPSKIEKVQVSSIFSETNWSKMLTGINEIVHLASQVHDLRKNTADPFGAYREVNVKGTQNLVDHAVEANVKRFIYISSVKVKREDKEVRSQKSPRLNTLEGNPVQRGRDARGQEDELKRAFSEKDIPNPQDPYAVSKWEAEKVLNKISEETGMEIVILRSPLVYGPRVKANFLRLLQIVDRGIPLPLASVNNLRSFIYLGNLLDAITTCMKHPNASGQTYFVSDGEDVSTPELIRRISSALGRPKRLFHCPTKVLQVAGKLSGKMTEIERLTGSLAVDISKIMTELDWAPPFSMEEGLKETARWYKKKTEVRG